MLMRKRITKRFSADMETLFNTLIVSFGIICRNKPDHSLTIGVLLGRYAQLC